MASAGGQQAGASPDAFRLRAQEAAGAENAARAAQIMEEAMGRFPDDAAIANSAGHFRMQAGDPASAEPHFARAVELEPGSLEYAVNRAIALSRSGRDREAAQFLEGYRAAGERDARYCSTRGAAERANGNLTTAADWYDACLRLAPTHGKALLGRARVALERGEADAAARFETSLAANRMEPEAWYGLAQAYDAAGDAQQARNIAAQLAQQAPHWVEVQRFLAQLRLAAGERDFADHFTAAERQKPEDRAIPLAHVEVLGGLDFDEQAAQVAADARHRFPQDPQFALLEAVHAGNAGDDERAEAIYSRLALETAQRWLQEARHRVRRGEYDRAEHLLDRADEETPWNISIWALRGTVWRLKGDPRSDWLHGQEGLVRKLALPGAEEVLAEAVPLLHRLHDGSALPLGQSLRGGTQTRGNLLDRTEPALARLREALEAALELYREDLPPVDESHPLLRHRDRPWSITGSWSVRLDGGGDYHTAHIHPQGIVSSALYCALPDCVGGGSGKDGWLELGRPAPDLRVDLPPLYEVEPETGHLALFPSSLYHGTSPFGSGRRMTVAFDIAPGDGARNERGSRQGLG